jgi:hypothetical protein
LFSRNSQLHIHMKRHTWELSMWGLSVWKKLELLWWSLEIKVFKWQFFKTFSYTIVFSRKLKSIETRNGEWWHGPACAPGQQTHGLHDVRPRARATEGK